MHPILFSVGNFHIYTYGIFVALGVIASGVIVHCLARYERLKIHSLFDTILYLVFVGFVSARLAYFIIYYYQFDSIWQFFSFWQGGLVAYGGIIGVIIFSVWYFHYHHEDRWRWLDIITLGFLVGWVLGQIGFFLGGNNPSAISNQTYLLKENWQILIEAGWILLIFISLMIIWRRKRLAHGMIFCLGLGALSLGKIIIDIGSGQALWGELTANQIASLIVLIGSCLTFFYLRDMIQANKLWRALGILRRR